MINYKLSEQCDRHRNALQAINEKIACFDDMKKELTQTKERYQESERARVALHQNIDDNNAFLDNFKADQQAACN